MGPTEQSERHRPDTQLDGMEAALVDALSETNSPEARYQIRVALQRIEVLRAMDLDGRLDHIQST